MMKIIMLLVIMIMSTACISNKNIQPIEEEVIQRFLLPSIAPIEAVLGYELYYGNYSEIHCVLDIPVWIKAHFNFKYTNTWNSPDQITKNGFMNLNDFTILLINIAKVQFDIEFDLVLIDTYNIMQYGVPSQAMIGYKGVIYSIFNLNYIILDQQPNSFYLFNEVFNTVHINSKTFV